MPPAPTPCAQCMCLVSSHRHLLVAAIEVQLIHGDHGHPSIPPRPYVLELTHKSPGQNSEHKARGREDNTCQHAIDALDLPVWSVTSQLCWDSSHPDVFESVSTNEANASVLNLLGREKNLLDLDTRDRLQMRWNDGGGGPCGSAHLAMCSKHPNKRAVM